MEERFKIFHLAIEEMIEEKHDLLFSHLDILAKEPVLEKSDRRADTT